jgi:hypothetical protein
VVTRGLVIVALLLIAPGVARADVDLDFLGPARTISHSSSASRDTAVLGLHVAPHRVLSGGGEVGLASLRAAGVTWRLGFYGMLELESEGETQGSTFVPWPEADIRFWRGHFGYHVAASLDDVDGWTLEGVLSLRHESEHYTGSNSGGAGTDYSMVPHVGDFLMLDVAARRPIGSVDAWARLQHRFYLPGRSGWSHAPAVELGARWRVRPRLHPFVSTFAEHAWGTLGFPDAYLARGLAGVIVPSDRGDIYVYLSADVGHREGLAVFTEERSLGAGVRLAFW